MNGNDDRDISVTRAEFIGYMKRAIEDIGHVNARLEARMDGMEKSIGRRLEKVEGRVNKIELKIAGMLGAGGIIFYIIRELIKRHVKIL